MVILVSFVNSIFYWLWFANLVAHVLHVIILEFEGLELSNEAKQVKAICK